MNGLWSIPEDNPGNKKEETPDDTDEKSADGAEQETKEASENTTENGETMEIDSEAAEEPEKVKEENGDAKDTPPVTPAKKVLSFSMPKLFNFAEFYVQHRRRWLYRTSYALDDRRGRSAE